MCDGVWWEARVIAVNDANVMIHYVGGEADEDEWISKDSERLRPARESKKRLSQASKAESQQTIKKDDAKIMCELGLSARREGRPKRQSSISSDDARLALALQEEELRASRAGRARSSASKWRGAYPRPDTRKNARLEIGLPVDECKSAIIKVKAQNQASEKKPAPDSRPDIQAQREENGLQKKTDTAVLSNIKIAASSLSHPQMLRKINGKAGDNKLEARAGYVSADGATRKLSQNDNAQSSKSDSRADKKVSGPSICFSLVPDEAASAENSIPALRRSRITLAEDSVVLNIKRRIVEEVCPGLGVADVDVRAPTGMLLGQDHSIKFVRTVLWPLSKGELVLRYRRHVNPLNVFEFLDSDAVFEFQECFSGARNMKPRGDDLMFWPFPST
jgi:hypothetical protein